LLWAGALNVEEVLEILDCTGFVGEVWEIPLVLDYTGVV